MYFSRGLCSRSQGDNFTTKSHQSHPNELSLAKTQNQILEILENVMKNHFSKINFIKGRVAKKSLIYTYPEIWIH